MAKTDTVRTRKDGEGALAWLAFLVVAVIGVAAVISGAIRNQVDPAPAADTRSVTDHPSPAPPPLPQGIKPGKSLSMNA